MNMEPKDIKTGSCKSCIEFFKKKVFSNYLLVFIISLLFVEIVYERNWSMCL